METNEIKNTAVQPGSEAFSVDDDAPKEATGIGIFTHKFTKPFTYEGRTYEELTFDLEQLTGRDSRLIENELRAAGHVVLVANFDSDYLIRVCARACTEKIGWDVLEAMPISDYNTIKNRVRNFLTRSASK